MAEQSSMVERVASAIDAVAGPEFEDGALGGGASHEGAKDFRQEQVALCARAAIEAMREPTEKMVLGGADVTRDRVRALAVYYAMIGAALEEKNP